MQASKDALFQLIKSLDKAEKRNFRLQNQPNTGNKKYLRLFDLIDKQSVYDEGRIVKALNDDTFTRQISVAKNYLFNSILRSLSHFYKGPVSGLRAMITQVQILHEKNLHPLALKLVRKAVGLAEREERFPEWLILLEMQREILTEHYDYARYHLLVPDIRKAEDRASLLMKNARAFQDLFDQVLFLTRTQVVGGRAVTEEALDALLAQPLMREESEALSVRAKITYWVIKEYIHRHRAELPQAITVGKRILALLDGHEKLRQELSTRHIYTLSNLAVYLFALRHKEDSLAMLERMKQVEVKSMRARMLVGQRYYSQRLNICQVSGDETAGRQLLEDAEQTLLVHRETLSRMEALLFYFSAARFHWQTGDQAASLVWLSRFLNEPRNEARSDLQCFARVLHLVVLLDKGDLNALEETLKPACRFIFKRNLMKGTLRAVIQFLQFAATAPPPDKFNAALSELREELRKFEQDPAEGPATRQLGLLLWAEAKLQGLPLNTLTRERYEASLELRRQRLQSGAPY